MPAFSEVCLASAKHPCAYRNKMCCSRVFISYANDCERGFLRATKGVLSAMSFVVMAVLGVAMVLSLVFMMYVLARPWL